MKVSDERLLITEYDQAARVTHLYLKEYCDESLPYPAMVADACRVAKEKIDRLLRANEVMKNKLEQMLEKQVVWESRSTKREITVQDLKEDISNTLSEVEKIEGGD